jgi:hypothetical protein
VSDLQAKVIFEFPAMKAGLQWELSFSSSRVAYRLRIVAGEMCHGHWSVLHWKRAAGFPL